MSKMSTFIDSVVLQIGLTLDLGHVKYGTGKGDIR